MPTKHGIPTSYATVSIGHSESHTLEKKLSAISAAGFDAIELGFPDIVTYASQQSGKDVKEDDYDVLVKHAAAIKTLCQDNKLEILMLQPFSNFEGWPKGSKEREQAFEKAKGWIHVMEACGTTMLQVGSSDSEGISSDTKVLAADLAELADLLSEKGFRLCYENWCWATHAPTWRHVYNIMDLADKSNIGLCLDTFQSAGGEWADPTQESGALDLEPKIRDTRWRASCRELSKTVPQEKIYLLQVSDAHKMSPPLRDKKYDGELRPRGYWSHAYRPIPFRDGYLPVTDFARAVLGTGFKGYFSMEVFDGREEEKYGDDLEAATKDAMASLEKLLDECGIGDENSKLNSM